MLHTAQAGSLLRRRADGQNRRRAGQWHPDRRALFGVALERNWPRGTQVTGGGQQRAGPRARHQRMFAASLPAKPWEWRRSSFRKAAQSREPSTPRTTTSRSVTDCGADGCSTPTGGGVDVEQLHPRRQPASVGQRWRRAPATAAGQRAGPGISGGLADAAFYSGFRPGRGGRTLRAFSRRAAQSKRSPPRRGGQGKR